MRRKLFTGLAIGIAALLGMATMAVAVNRTAKGGANSGIVIATSDDNAAMSSTTYTALPGMTASFTTPKDTITLLDIRFSAESACYGGDAGQPDWCSVRIMVDGGQANPNNCKNALDFAFDSSDNGSESAASWESHAMERFVSVPGGTHRVVVEGAIRQFGTNADIFWTGERNLTVEMFPRLSVVSQTCPATTAPTGPGQAPASPVTGQ
jgi:hypothetical protein